MRKTIFSVLPLLALSLPLAAPLSAEAGLPDAAAVNTALDDHPSVVTARAKVDAARADARARAKGPHEITFSGTYNRRTIDQEGTFDEYDAQLSRAFRLPGKAELDRNIGEFGVDAAQNMAEDAKHQAALLLAGHWWDWLGASAEAEVDRQAAANYEQALAAVKRRVELKDAAPLEADQVEAALGNARLMAQQSEGRASVARARLAAHFPALAVPLQAPEIPSPQIPEGGLEHYRELVVTNSHEIAAADAQAGKMNSMAERARREKMADPSFGVRLFSERGGAEKGAGLVFSIPLGGGHRSALSDQAAAEAGAAQADAQMARFSVREMADSDVAEATYRFEAWQRAREGLNAQIAALAKMRKGYELGEIDLADRLLAERMVHDAFRAEATARTEAQRAITKIRIDSHQLWLAD
ncbi:TolC family protein [Altererythrobacter sp. CC-YST694]|uniref:TolC family protein n=1 Tax=Altererythrobacter sp. CC-YST694 TaxID=2755038 RepID=UPI001D01A2CB|nr:TolC family protein [Altererythrobacter sp. CC-YST694]MCB5425019.1 TolC family protein [Altererythrobacter sp. CC-YST694]